jgi:hypothetical protein
VLWLVSIPWYQLERVFIRRYLKHPNRTERVTQSCHRFRPRVEINPLVIAVDRQQ